MEIIENRIKSKRIALKYTLRSLAEEVGVTHTTISQWERGSTKPTGENLVELSKALKVTPEWITHGSSHNLIQLERSGSSNSTLINYYDQEQKTEAVANRILKGRKIQDIRLLEIIGDSMLPIIKPNTIAAIDLSQKEIVDGKLYLIKHGNIERIKALSLTSTGIRLHSYNSDYGNESVNRADIKIIGNLFWLSSLI